RIRGHGCEQQRCQDDPFQGDSFRRDNAILTAVSRACGPRRGSLLALGPGVFRTFRLPITWLELFKRTAREASHDNILGLAAQLAYYFLLALVPAILSVAAFITFLP